MNIPLSLMIGNNFCYHCELSQCYGRVFGTICVNTHIVPRIASIKDIFGLLPSSL